MAAQTMLGASAPETLDTGRIRVVLVDAQPVLRAGLRALVEVSGDVEVAGEAATTEDAITSARRIRPDVVLLDISSGSIDGEAATRQICTECPATRVLILTGDTDDEVLLRALKAGGSGYVALQFADSQLLDAVRTVHAGEVFLDPAAARMLLHSFRASANPAAESDPLETLSSREREVLTRTVEGFSSAEIGEELQIRPKTVDTYRRRLMEKLQLRHRSELIRFALRRGLLSASD